MGGNRKLGSTISNGLDIEPYEYDNRVEIKGLLVRYQIDRNIIFRTKAGWGSGNPSIMYRTNSPISWKRNNIMYSLTS